MHADAFLQASERLPLASACEILRDRPAVILAPHPDDETIGCGGLIALAGQAGITLEVVILSDGTGSHPGSRRYPPVRLRAVREAESVRAALVLGLDPAALSFLRLPDRFVPSEGVDAMAAARQVAAIAQRIEAATLLVTWGEDPHCDHQAAARIARLVARRMPGLRLLAYPVWGWNLPPTHEVADGEPKGLRLDIGQVADAKRRAILAHASQVGRLIDDDPTGFRLPDAMIERFATAPEIFLEMAR